MPNRPDKFGIKFWILAELSSKFYLNLKPYLGKDEEKTASLGTHTVMNLLEPYYGRGYNVTADNFFTSAELAKKLLDKRTSLVGTLRLNRKEMPSVCTKMDTQLSLLQLRVTEPSQVPGQTNENCRAAVNTAQRSCMPDRRKEKARVHSLLQ